MAVMDLFRHDRNREPWHARGPRRKDWLDRLRRAVQRWSAEHRDQWKDIFLVVVSASGVITGWRVSKGELTFAQSPAALLLTSAVVCALVLFGLVVLEHLDEWSWKQWIVYGLFGLLTVSAVFTGLRVWFGDLVPSPLTIIVACVVLLAAAVVLACPEVLVLVVGGFVCWGIFRAMYKPLYPSENLMLIVLVISVVATLFLTAAAVIRSSR